MPEIVKVLERLSAAVRRRSPLHEPVPIGRAKMRITHRRPTGLIRNAAGLMVPDPRSYVMVDEPEEVWNLITNNGRDVLHKQCYGTITDIVTNGFNYIALSNDPVTETAASTVLSNEITTNGLGRASGTFAHTAGTNTSTIDHTFTATGAQSCQKAALFTALVAGTMNHVLGFTQRNLVLLDTIDVTYTISLG